MELRKDRAHEWMEWMRQTWIIKLFILLCFSKTCYFQLHFTHEHEITLLTHAMNAHKRHACSPRPFIYSFGSTRQGYITVENFWSWFPGLIQTKYKVSASIWEFTWKWKGEFSRWCWVRVQNSMIHSWEGFCFYWLSHWLGLKAESRLPTQGYD